MDATSILGNIVKNLIVFRINRISNTCHDIILCYKLYSILAMIEYSDFCNLYFNPLEPEKLMKSFIVHFFLFSFIFVADKILTPHFLSFI